MRTRVERILTGLAALAVAAVIWLPCLHFFFTRPVSEFRQAQGLTPEARQLAAGHLQLCGPCADFGRGDSGGLSAAYSKK